MFSGCMEITSLNLINFETNEVKDMTKMFEYLTLTSLDLSNFNTSNVLSMLDMFALMISYNI